MGSKKSLWGAGNIARNGFTGPEKGNSLDLLEWGRLSIGTIQIGFPYSSRLQSCNAGFCIGPSRRLFFLGPGYPSPPRRLASLRKG